MSSYRSHLHLHDLIVGSHDFISYLHEKLERKVRLLGREGDFMQIFAFAGEEFVYRIGRIALKAFHFGNGISQNGFGTPTRQRLVRAARWRPASAGKGWT